MFLLIINFNLTKEINKMIREVNEHEFISELVNDDYNSMTYEGAKVLFDWFNCLEESTIN